MGHRHLPGSHQTFDDEHDQGWIHIHQEHPYSTLARPGTSENRSHIYQAENVLNEGVPVSSHWNSSPGPYGYTASGHNVERPHYNPGASSGPSHHDPFVSSAVATFSHVTCPSSSNCNNSQTWPNASFVDQSMENVRGAQKRKSPCPSSIYEMGSSSQYCGERTSSAIPFSSEFQLGKSITRDHDPHYMPWLMDPTFRSNNLSIRDEGCSRNVRSRPTLDLESSLDRNNLPRSPNLDYHSTHHSVEHSGSSHFPGQTSHGSKDWNCARLSPAPRDINGFSAETANFLPVRSVDNSASVDTSGYHHGIIGNRINSTVPHGFAGTSTQSPSSSRFSHRSTPTYRSSSSGMRLGSSGDRSHHMVSESYPSRHLRPSPHISWRSGDRPGRRRSSYERFQPPPFDEVALHERFTSEGYMVVDRQQQYASRNMLDHHREMRLDIDNMTYEELLALGERIGSVNTGLSNSEISSCLLETRYYYPLYEVEEQGKCAICLEEYKEKEELGEVKGCGHDYHGRCIKKWLSMKNSCPICKSPALPDASKNP